MSSVFKWSRFNFLYESPKYGYLLYNSYSNSFLKLNNSLYEDLIHIRNKGEYNLKDSLFSVKEIDFFKKSYFLVEDDDVLVEKLHFYSMERLFDKKHLVLTIAPTQNCNFDCTYCYEKWRTPGRMSNDTENSIIRYLENQRDNNGLESLTLTWYGGEPLLEYSRIKSLGKRLKKLGLRFIDNEIITNGYLFDNKVPQLLVNLEISSVQITLDGLKDIHDIRRPLKSGRGTFDKIIYNLDNYFESNICDKLQIVVRVNIDKSNSTDFYEIRDWLIHRYPFKNFHIYPGWIYLEDGHKKKCDCLKRNDITDFCIDFYKKKGVLYENLFPKSMNVECLARSPYSMVIGWQGEIYKCYEDIGNESLVVGNINTSEIWTNLELISKYATGIDHYQDIECQKCSYLPICDGGCPLRRIENKYTGAKNDCCTRFKGREQELLDLYYESKML